MFATLLGALPMPPDGALESAIEAQVEAGLEPLTDGRLRDPDFEHLTAAIRDAADPARWSVGLYRDLAARSSGAAKQTLPGPYSLGRRIGGDDAARREAATALATTRLREAIEALVAEGCPIVEVEESEAHRIGSDEAERRRFRVAHEQLTDGLTGTHLSLALVGGAAIAAGTETILAGAYASLAVDLIAGPDDWSLVRQLPGDRGVVVGALSAKDAAESTELLLWGARYAASTNGRGIARVGVGSAGSWSNLTWDEALRRMRRLGDVARLGAMPPSDELARGLDPRGVSSRRAALGHDAPKPPRRRRR